MVRYHWSGSDAELPTPGIPDDDAGGWLLTLARTARNSAVPGTVTMFTDDAFAIGIAVDEDYWQNRVRPDLWQTPPVQAFTDGTDFRPNITKVEDDYWQNRVRPQLWPTPPVQAFTDSGQDEGNLHAGFVIEEDYFLNPARPRLWMLPSVQAMFDHEPFPGVLVPPIIGGGGELLLWRRRRSR